VELVVQALIGLMAGFVGGLLGIGGSTIILPALIIYLSYSPGGYGGNDQHLLQGAAMICNVFISGAAVVAHFRARAVMKPVVVRLIPSALVGILLGGGVSNSSVFARDNGKYLAMLLAVFLGYVAVYNIVRMVRPESLASQFDENKAIAPWKVVATGLPMGLMAGLLGIGGGSLCVPTQQILLRLPLRRAIANSAVTIVFASLAGAIYKNMTLSQHGFSVTMSLKLALMLVPTAILGSYLGGRLTHVLPHRVLRIIFILFMGTVTYLTLSKALAAG